MSDQHPPRSVRVGDLVIEPVERVVTRVERLGGAVVGIAFKEPIAVVFRTPDRTWRVELEDVATR